MSKLESAVSVERLIAGEGDRWRRIRLQALEEAPHAFGTTFAEASSWPDTRWEQQVVDIATFVAVVGGDDVGVARGAAHAERADVRELISMWVATTARRRGIGAKLIDVVADWAKAQGATALVLDVVEHNEPAIASYARSGFELFEGDSLGERAPGEVRMIKALVWHS
jgi:GNAT superfamily N-acetyltransferase